MIDDLVKLGFDPSLLDHAGSSIPEDCIPVRVTQVQKESYFVTDGAGEVYAEVTGKLMFSAESSLELPVTGDWVMAQIMDRSLAIIHEVLPRKSILKRKTPGKRTEFQPIAANIDTALIVQALDDDFSPRRLERYLIMVRDGGIEPLVLLSKSDLLEKERLAERKRKILEVTGNAAVISFSNETRIGLPEIQALLEPGKTFCLIGSSGVGKSTLLNNLLGAELMVTKSIREKDGKGRHTTTARQLILLPWGAMVIDTPGMRELANIGAGSGIAETFEEFADLAETCRFSNCTHRNEAGCAVLEAVEAGDISNERFESYEKMRKESDYHQATFLEIRNKHKKLGKLYRSIQKENKKN